MFVRAITPKGQVTCLDLGLIPIWRLELVANNPCDLGIGLRYVTSGTTSVAMLAALDCLCTLNDIKEVAKVGFPKEGIAANKQRLQEAMKILTQADIKEATAMELIAKSVGLVDIYYQVLAALRTGADDSGFYENWKWIVSRESTGWEIPSKPEKKE